MQANSDSTFLGYKAGGKLWGPLILHACPDICIITLYYVRIQERDEIFFHNSCTVGLFFKK